MKNSVCIFSSFDEARGKSLPESVLVSATDGNHGFGLAHVGNLFELKVKVNKVQMATMGLVLPMLATCFSLK